MTDTVRECSSGKGEVEMMRRVIIEANNSLYGSHGFFLSASGGEPDPYHLARPIEDLKKQTREQYALSTPDRARVEVLEEAARVAEQWRDENKAACSKARPTDSRQADRLYGAAVECNAIAATIRALAHTTAVSGE